MMPASAESVLIALSGHPSHKPLKIVSLAKMSSVSVSSCKRALKCLRDKSLIVYSRPAGGGPDAVYSFEILPPGHQMLSFLRIADISMRAAE